MTDHEDYLPGEAPAAHKTTHQDGGTDEISIDDLEGIPAELATHALLPTVHQDAPALILIHKGVAGAHHAKYTDAEAVIQADVRIGIHAALPTVHQDAPDLILTHKGDAGAHHARYTDAEVRALFSPISIPPAAFMSYSDIQNWIVDQTNLINRVALTVQYFIAPVYLPNGVTITKLTLYGYRDDALAIMNLQLNRIHRIGGAVQCAGITADWIAGWSSDFDDTISYAVVNNELYAYLLFLVLDPNNSVYDVRFSGAKIEFTG